MADNNRIAWHQGFYGALEIELRANKEQLTFTPEWQLSKEPMRVDMLVIEKTPDVVIENEIGSIFRQYNLFEYKSPEDSLSIDEFYKAVGYVFLYKSTADHVDGRPMGEMTLSLVRDVPPEKLFKTLEAQGFSIRQAKPGVYYVEGQLMFPTQIIVTRELTAEAHRSLRILKHKAEAADVEAFLTEAIAWSDQGDRQNADAVLQVSVSANRELYDQLKGRGGIMCEALKELMKEDILDEKIKVYVEAKKECDVPDNDIIKGIMSKFGVAFEAAKKYVLPAMA